MNIYEGVKVIKQRLTYCGFRHICQLCRQYKVLTSCFTRTVKNSPVPQSISSRVLFCRTHSLHKWKTFFHPDENKH
jgi:hypothetical protein